MQKMLPEYAQKLLDGGYAFGNSFFSYHDGLLVIECDQDYYPYSRSFYGTQLKDGLLQLDDEGYVVFHQVTPIIDESTRFTL